MHKILLVLVNQVANAVLSSSRQKWQKRALLTKYTHCHKSVVWPKKVGHREHIDRESNFWVEILKILIFAKFGITAFTEVYWQRISTCIEALTLHCTENDTNSWFSCSRNYKSDNGHCTLITFTVVLILRAIQGLFSLWTIVVASTFVFSSKIHPTIFYIHKEQQHFAKCVV